jgi:hypothetical protein
MYSHTLDEVALPKPWLTNSILLAFGAVLILASVGQILAGDNSGIITLLFGLVCALPLLLLKSVGVTLDREGFSVRNLFGEKRYSWFEVGEFRVARIGRTKFIVFDVSDKDRNMLEHMNKFLTGGGSNVPGALIGGSIQDACDTMNAYRRRVRGGR